MESLATAGQSRDQRTTGPDWLARPTLTPAPRPVTMFLEIAALLAAVAAVLQRDRDFRSYQRRRT